MKNHVLNIFLLGMLLLGYAIVTNTAFGWVLMAVPAVVWGKRPLKRIHQNIWMTVLFWAAIAWLKWQMAVALFALFLVAKGISNTISLFKRLPTEPSENDACIDNKYIIHTRRNNWRKRWSRRRWYKNWVNF